MKRAQIALLLAAAMLLCACAGAASASQAQQSEESRPALQPAELPLDETVLGTACGEDVLYTDYRLYLDLQDSAYRDSLRNELAINLLLEEEMEKRGISTDPEEFKTYSAEAYYNEMFSDPSLIEEIAAACEQTEMTGEALERALYEVYRQGYYVGKLGDHYSEAYRAENGQGEQSEEEYEDAVLAYANDQLYAMADTLTARIQIPESEELLAIIDGREIPLDERHQSYLLFAMTRNRLNMVNEILYGEAMRHALREADALEDTSEFAESYREYLAPTFESEEFTEAYGPMFASRGVTTEQVLESVVRSFTVMSEYAQPYYNLLQARYEAMAEADRPETFEEYYSDCCAKLYAQCEAVHPMG